MKNEAYLVPNPVSPCMPVKIDSELCIGCYRCADQCRVDVMVRNSPREGGFSRCEVSCPAGEDIRWTTYYIEKGHFTDAWQNIRRENPFPGICGRVCFHPCEEKCARIDLDTGVATNALERAAFDFADHHLVPQPQKRPPTGKKVAVIGGGPAGLTCAYFLALLGHAVTIFEAQSVAGGIPRLHIPEFRLPVAVVDQEISEVKNLGVEIRLNTRVDAVSFTRLKTEYDACFIATGAQVSQKLNVPGENLPGVMSALEFLHSVRLGQNITVGQKVAVIGGGNVATDSARLARRLGAAEVILICLESRDIMPAYPTEIAAAESEGVAILPGWGVRNIKGCDTVTGIELKSCTAVYNKEGRFDPVYDETSIQTIEVDTVISAIGQTADLSFVEAVARTGSRINTDPDTLATPLPGIFAGGDVGSPIRSIVQAIASGKRAAISIDLYLQGGDPRLLKDTGRGAVSMSSYLSDGTISPQNHVPDEPATACYRSDTRAEPELIPLDDRIISHREVNRGLTRNQAIAEAARCFHCNQYNSPLILYPDECWFCGTCVEECPVPGAIRMDHPLNQKIGWKRKETGELFRIGMKNPPPPNIRPPVG